MRHSIYRMAAALLAGCLLCGVPAGVLAEQENGSESVGTADAAAQEQQAGQIAEYTGTKPYVSAQGYCVIDAATGEVIVGNQEQEVFAPASITKIMTLLVAAEHCADLDEMVSMSESALDALELMSSTISPMPKPGELFSIRSLMYGMIMKSGNECANLLAERVAGSLDAFADLMNQRAAQAGALQTHFSNPSGLDADNHKTTPYDMAMIMKAALENPTAAAVLSAGSYTIPATEFCGERAMTSGHGMLNGSTSCEGVFAGKSGYTVQAKWTLATAAVRGDRTLIAVVMKCDEGCSYADTEQLLNFAYQKIQGEEPSQGGLIYNPQLVEYDDSGFTMTWTVGPDAFMAEFPVWMESDDSVPMTREKATVSGTELRYRVNLSDHDQKAGVYTVQAYVYDKNGTPRVSTVKVLAGAGNLQPGMTEWNGAWYYIRSNGTLALNWLELEDTCYYFDYTTGQRQTGFIAPSGTTFYLDADGKLVNGWQEIDGKTYYFQVPGDMVTGTMLIDGFPWLFGNDGALIQMLPSFLGEVVGNSLIPLENKNNQAGTENGSLESGEAERGSENGADGTGAAE